MALITDQDDRTLVEQHRAGDPDAFRRIVSRHHRSLYSNALRRLGDPNAAEDAVQDAFLRAFRNIEHFDGDYHLDAWLHRIVTNTCHDIGRRRGRDTRLFDRACTEVEVEVAPADQALDAMPLEEITGALDALPESYREVLVLRFVDELSYADVAERAGISEENARARVSRGRTMLKRMLTSTSALLVWAIPPLRRQTQLTGAEAEAANNAASQVHGLATMAATAPAPTSALSQFSGIIAQAGPTIASAAPAVTSSAPTLKAAVAVGLAASVAIPAGVAVDRARQAPTSPAAEQVEDSSSVEAPGAPVDVKSTERVAAAAAPTTSVAAVGAVGLGLGGQVAAVDPSASPAAPSTTVAPAPGTSPSTSTPPTSDLGSPSGPNPAPTPAPAEEPPPAAPVPGPAVQLSAAVSVAPAGDRLLLSGPMTLDVGDELLLGQLSGKLHLGALDPKAEGRRDVYRSEFTLTLAGGRVLDLMVDGSSKVTLQGGGERHELSLRFALIGGEELGLAGEGDLAGTLVLRKDAGELGLAIPGATQEP